MNSRERTVLWVAILASFVAFLDGSIVNVALPAIARNLGGGILTQQWVVDSYLLTLGSLILVAGTLSDIYGRVRVLRLGLILFGAASLLCAASPASSVLIGARAIQGVGAALLVPSSLALITATFNDPLRAKAIGLWTGWTGTAFIVGPVLGGVLVDSVSWRLIFAINVVPIAATLILLRGLADPLRTGPRASVDVVGAVLAAVGLAGPVFALIVQDRYGWAAPLVLVPFIAGLACLAVFLWWETRARHPMMPLKLFRVRNFGMGNLATAGIYAGISLGVFIIPIFLQEVAGLSAAAAGLATVPVTIMSLSFSALFGTLAGKFGPHLFMALGPLVAGLGFLYMVTAHAPLNYWAHILPGVVLFGLGLSITVAPLTAAVLGSISPAQSGIGSAINNAVSRVAGLLAIACAGAIIGGTLDYPTFHRAVLVTAILLFCGAGISAVGIRNGRLGEAHVPPEAAANCHDRIITGGPKS